MVLLIILLSGFRLYVTAVLTNGLRSRYFFFLHRGTRPVCPLSPLHLAAEPLAEAIRSTSSLSDNSNKSEAARPRVLLPYLMSNGLLLVLCIYIYILHINTYNVDLKWLPGFMGGFELPNIEIYQLCARVRFVSERVKNQ